MIIDCDTCVVRGRACSDCVITVLLRTPPIAQPSDEPPSSPWASNDPTVREVTGVSVSPWVTGSSEPPTVELDADEQRAVHALAARGLVPPLRLVRPTGPEHQQIA
jgi:hypothetical protein